MMIVENNVIFIAKKLIMEDGKQFFDNYFAIVKAITNEAVVVEKSDGEQENLPTGEEFYTKAEPGVYELENGTLHEDPDYIAEFIIYESDAAYQKFNDD